MVLLWALKLRGVGEKRLFCVLNDCAETFCSPFCSQVEGINSFQCVWEGDGSY